MGDASMSQQPPIPDPNVDPNNTGGDPASMDNGMLDPNMTGGSPDMMGGDPMGGEMNDGNPNKVKKDIQKNIGKACDDYRNYQGQDKEQLGSWISGMLDSLDGDDDENANMDDNSDSIEKAPTDMQNMPMETFIFKKGQLEKINEIFGAEELSKKKEKPENDKIKNNGVKNTPFNNPNYGK